MPLFRTLILWALMFAALVMMFSQFRSQTGGNVIPYSEFMSHVSSGRITAVKVNESEGRLYGRDDLGNVTITDAPADVFMIFPTCGRPACWSRPSRRKSAPC